MIVDERLVRVHVAVSDAGQNRPIVLMSMMLVVLVQMLVNERIVRVAVSVTAAEEHRHAHSHQQPGDEIAGVETFAEQR
jgi:hypothetical protein